MAPNRDAVVTELIEAGVVEEAQVSEVEATLRANLAAGQKALTGSEYILDQSRYLLIARAYPDGAEEYRLEIPRPQGFQAFKADNWEFSGTHVTLLNPDTSKKAEDIPWEISAEQHFIAASQGLFLSGDFMRNHNLPLSQEYILPAKAKQIPPNGPLDAFFSPSLTWLALMDRSAGQVHLIQLKEGQLHKSFAVKAPGSSKAVIIRFREQAQQLVLIDGSSSLGIWSFDGEEIQKLSPGAGLLSNGVVSPDEKVLLAMATKPSQGLKVIDLNSGEMLKDISIKGDLYSVKSDAPTDLMVLGNQGQNLLFMTFLNEPEPFTPVISVVDIERRKTTQRYAIKDGTRPCLLTLMEINPLGEKNQTLVDMLLNLELITAEDLHEARMALREKQQAAAAVEIPQGNLLDLEQRAFEEAQKEPEEEEEEAPAEGGEPEFKPEKAPQMNVSPAADELIVELCANRIFNESRGEIDLLNSPDYGEALGRLRSAASRARSELEWYTGAIIKLKALIDDKPFKQVITREQIQDMLHRHERDTLVKSQRATVPSNCPNCSKPLFGSYICSYCGYEIERPEELIKRGIISIASIGPLDNLAKDHVLLIDIEGKRILEIDGDHHIVWTLGKDMLSDAEVELDFPRDAVRLATRNTLITDYTQNRVVEITPSGRLFWDYRANKSPEHMLKNPVRATANGLNHILIVDQGRHRVLEVDKQSDILMQFGHTDRYGIAEDMLNMPSDVQRLASGNLLITDTGNHRLLEVEDWKVVWQYGNPENLETGGYGSDPGYLSYPQSAVRLNNGNTLIVDAGNLRVLEINAEKEILWEHKTNEGPEEHQMDSPFRAAYVNPQEVLILSETSLLQIEPAQNKVLWACQLSEFERAKVKLQQEEKTKRFVKHGVKNPYMRYKQTATADASEDAQKRMKELIAQRLANTRSGGSSKAHVTRYGDEELLPLDFFLVERSKNRILRTDREGHLSWRYGENANELLFKPHACTRTAKGHILIADTDQHRILEVNPEDSKTVWEFGTKGKSGVGDKGLNRPRFAQELPNGHLLIVDQNNRRVFELRRNFQIVWSYEGMDHLMAPYHAEKLDNGHILITDWGAHLVFEINAQREVVWSFGERKTSGSDRSHLSYPEHATRLANGHTLITDTRNDRVIEVNSEGKVVWILDGHEVIKFGSPTYSRRLKNGHTLVVHGSNRQMLEVNPKLQLYWKFMLPFERPTISRPATAATESSAAQSGAAPSSETP